MKITKGLSNGIWIGNEIHLSDTELGIVLCMNKNEYYDTDDLKVKTI